MNEKTPKPSDETPVPSGTTGEGVAEHYVADELKKARVVLRQTQIISALSLLSLALYLGWMTFRVVQYAQPDQAAEVATGLIAERVNTQAPEMAEQFKAKIPEVMAQLPDQAIQKLPEFRQALVARVESDLRTHAAASSDEMGKNFDTFLDANKDQLKTVMEVGADKDALKSIGPAIDKELLAYLEVKPEGGGDSIRESLDKSLSMLNSMKVTTDRLVANKGLTPQELKTRQAIAIITRTVKKETGGVDIKQAVLNTMDSANSSKALTGAVDATTGGTNTEIPADSTANTASPKTAEAAT